MNTHTPILTAIILMFALTAATAQQWDVGRIAGVVTDSAGCPIPGARIHIGETRRGAKSRHDGTFVIDGLPAGGYDVTIMTAGFTPWTGRVQVIAGYVATIHPILTSRSIGVGYIMVCSIPTYIRPDRIGTGHALRFDEPLYSFHPIPSTAGSSWERPREYVPPRLEPTHDVAGPALYIPIENGRQ